MLAWLLAHIRHLLWLYGVHGCEDCGMHIRGVDADISFDAVLCPHCALVMDRNYEAYMIRTQANNAQVSDPLDEYALPF